MKTTLPPQATSSCVTPYKIFVAEDHTLGLYLVMVQKGEAKPIHVAHFATKEEAENFIS